MRFFIILSIALSVAPHVAAERFLGFSPGDRLTDAHKRYPNATFEEERPAWLQPYQRLIKITGSGIDGVVALKLEHEVDAIASTLKDLAVKNANRIPFTPRESLAFESLQRTIKRLRESPPPDPWEVKDIRWEPPKPIVLKALTGKYGSPEKDEQDEQFRRVLKWETRGVTAYLNGADVVQLLIFDFSLGDHLCASRWKQGDKCDPLNPTGIKRKPAIEKPSQNGKQISKVNERAEN